MIPERETRPTVGLMPSFVIAAALVLAIDGMLLIATRQRA